MSMSSTARDTERMVYGRWTRGARALRRQHTWSCIAGAGYAGPMPGYCRPMTSRPLREASAEWGDFVEVPAREQIAGPTCCTADSHK